MRIVTFEKDVLPRRKGETMVLPESVAERLVASGEVKDSGPYPPPDVSPLMCSRVVEPPKRPLLGLGRKLKKGATYG